MQMESEVPSEPAGTSQRPSNVLVPRLLALFGSPYEDAKCLSVSIMNLLAGGSPSALAEHMDRSAALPPPPCCSVPLERQRLEASQNKSLAEPGSLTVCTKSVGRPTSCGDSKITLGRGTKKHLSGHDDLELCVRPTRSRRCLSHKGEGLECGYSEMKKLGSVCAQVSCWAVCVGARSQQRGEEAGVHGAGAAAASAARAPGATHA